MVHMYGPGGKGLRGRLGNELRWQREYIERLEEGDPIDTGAAMQVPLVRIAAESGPRCYIAEARPANWMAPEEVQVPATAQEWERFIQEASALLTGHRSIIGGGAWKNKAGPWATACRPQLSRGCVTCAPRTGPTTISWASLGSWTPSAERLQPFVDQVRAQQQAGRLGDELDPACLTIMLMAAAMATTNLPHVIEGVCRVDPRSSEFVHHYEKQLAVLTRLLGLDSA